MGKGGSTEFNNEIDYFINEMCGMVITGQTALLDIEKGNAAFNWTFVPIPAAEGGKSYSTLGGWFSMINGKGEHVQETVDFLNWLYFESDYVADLCKAFYQLSPLASADAKLDSLYEETDFKLIYDYIEAGEMTCKAEIAFSSEVLEKLGEMLSSIVYETTTTEEAQECVQTFIDGVGATVQ